ncbi:hypothetical protein FRC03_011655 [Tulasnella sp. 419]|nr:hypothetical protein FRC03_011655 [Tulasnella sp. 419]
MVEEVPDEDDNEDSNDEGPPVVDVHSTAVRCHSGVYCTEWDKQRRRELEAQQELHHLFDSVEEYELAKWLATSGLSQAAINAFLCLDTIRTRVQPSFASKYEFFKKVNQLPIGPAFTRMTVLIKGDLLDEEGNVMTEEVEMFVRDPVECVEFLIGNPMYRDDLTYAPAQVYTSANCKTRVYHKMWSADWWWNLQNMLPEGATIAPVIIALDKTCLLNFSGDKSVYPVYITIGNLSKGVRRQPSQQATLLLGYLPIPSLACCSDDLRSSKSYEVFHECMLEIMASMEKYGQEGKEMVCADGKMRKVFPILGAYIADYPEQYLVACTHENRCPRCLVDPTARGHSTPTEPQHQTMTLELLRDNYDHHSVETTANLDEIGLRDIYPPFWINLPHTDIFSCFTPDLLHQVHKGVFKTHLVSWCKSLMAKGVLDRHYQSMPVHPSLRHFKKGIMHIKQWTGKEYKMMEKVFIGAIAGGITNPRVVTAARALLDVIFLSQLPTHTSKTLDQMAAALNEFHCFKDMFVMEQVRTHFNIPKIHALLHYVEAIRSWGAADGFNTESPERLHIDYAKKPTVSAIRRMPALR